MFCERRIPPLFSEGFEAHGAHALTLRTHIPRLSLGSFQTGHITQDLGWEKVGAEPQALCPLQQHGAWPHFFFCLFVFCFVSDCPGLSFNMKVLFFCGMWDLVP